MARYRTFSSRDYRVSPPSVRRRLGRGLVAATIAAVAILSAYRSVTDRPETARLVTPAGSLQVVLANTADQRAAGLSNRDAIPHGGMLLQWDTPGRHPIWMSEMRFALDLVWLDADGHVVAALANVPLCTTTPCPLYEPPGSEESVAVLELPAGKAATYGLTVGAVVSWE